MWRASLSRTRPLRRFKAHGRLWGSRRHRLSLQGLRAHTNPAHLAAQHGVGQGRRHAVGLIGDLPTGDGILGLLMEHPVPIRIDNLSTHPSSAGFPPHHPEMTSFPGALFIADPLKDKIALSESRRMSIPVVAISDTNCNPDLIDHPIPANDDAIRAVLLIASKIADAVIEGQQMRGVVMAEEGEEYDVADVPPALDTATEEYDEDSSYDDEDDIIVIDDDAEE